MAASFKNPANGYVEEFGALSVLAMLFLGAIYLAYRGLWGHFIIWMIFVVPFLVALGPPGLMLAMVVSLIYACCMPSILRTQYLRKGWVEVS